MQIGLTTEEMQQLQGVSLEQLVSAFRAESASFSRGSSAYRGVAYHKRQCKYQAQLRIEGGKTVYLGQFICEEDAARAYDAAVRQHHGRCSCQGPEGASAILANSGHAYPVA